MKIIYHAKLWSIVNKIWSSILQKWSGSNLHQIVGSFFTKKTLLSTLGKWKMDFSCNKNENFLWQTCCPFQYAPICTKWDHLGKLSFETSTNIGHLAWKPWTFILDSSFWEDFFKIFALFKVCCFVWLLGHKLGCNANVLHFFDFFWIV